MKLYLEEGFPDGWAYSIEQIARIMDMDRKTAVQVIREESVQALRNQASVSAPADTAGLSH